MKSLAFSTSLRRVFLSAVAASSLLSAGQVFGQVNGAGPSDPAFFNTVINIPEDQAVYTGQRLGDVFNRTTQFNLSGGTVIDRGLSLGDGAEGNISGGILTVLLIAGDGSELNVTGGNLASVSAARDSQTNISGGIFGQDLTTSAGSEVTISGGIFSDGVDFRSESNVTLLGGEFKLNGVAYSDSTISLNEGDTFTGVFQNGEAFIFSDFVGDSIATDVNLTTTALPVPTSDNFVVTSADPAKTPSSLRTGQTLTIVEGAFLPNVFESVGGTIDVNGGVLGRVTTSESSIDVSAGSINSLSVLNNGQLNVSGGQTANILLSSSDATISGSGTVIAGLITADSSQLDVQDATLSSGFVANDSVVNISGSTELTGSFRAANSEINISDNVTLRNLSSGTFIYNIEDSRLNISGGTVGAFNGALSAKNSTIHITGGATDLTASNSQITIEGGSIEGSSPIRLNDSETTLSGGRIAGSLEINGGTLNVLGGQIGSGLSLNPFQSTTSGTINVSGGEIGRAFGISTTGVANISGGTIGDDFTVSEFQFARQQGGTANISGGVIGNDMSVNFGGTANVSGGQIGNNFIANDGSVVNISGGTFGSSFDAFSDSEVTISGGEFGNQFTANLGSTVAISGGNFATGFRGIGPGVELQGGEFKLNGADISAVPNISINVDDVLTGVLADGSAFIFNRQSNDFLSNVTLSNVALPTLDTTPIVVNSAVPDRPSGLRGGQSLNLQAGGVLGNNFEAVDAVVNIEAGTVGDEFGAARSTVNIDGGTIGNAFQSHAGSVINVNGGSIGDNSRAYNGSVVNISDGTIGDTFSAAAGSEVNISGGRIGRGFDANRDSLVRINGGTFGTGFDAFSNSDVEFFGGEFQFNGEAFTESTITLGAGVFTGTLEDGSVFIFAGEANDRLFNVKLNQTALPDVDTTPIFVSSLTPNAPSGLRFGQTLVLEEGGVINGGFEAVGGVIDINGGSFEGDTAFANTIVNLNDGVLGGDALAFAGSEFNLFGGTIDGLVAGLGSEVNIHGGILENRLTADAGSAIDVFATEFSINGDEVEFIDFDSPLLIENRNFTLSGVFLDGSDFNYFVGTSFTGDFRVSNDATFRLNLVSAVPEPSATFLLALSGIVMIGRRRRS